MALPNRYSLYRIDKLNFEHLHTVWIIPFDSFRPECMQVQIVQKKTVKLRRISMHVVDKSIG